jgi:hypothetical protein
MTTAPQTERSGGRTAGRRVGLVDCDVHNTAPSVQYLTKFLPKQVIAQLESDEMLLYGSDHPHRHEVGVDQILGLLSPEQGERLLWRNAAETYGFDLEDRAGQVVAAGGERAVN